MELRNTTVDRSQCASDFRKPVIEVNETFSELVRSLLPRRRPLPIRCLRFGRLRSGHTFRRLRDRSVEAPELAVVQSGLAIDFVQPFASLGVVGGMRGECQRGAFLTQLNAASNRSVALLAQVVQNVLSLRNFSHDTILLHEISKPVS
jgi:hypothetical protein